MVGTPRKTPYVSLNLTPEARDALRALTIDLTTDTGRRLNQSEALLAALTIAAHHRDQLITHLRGPQ